MRLFALISHWVHGAGWVAVTMLVFGLPASFWGVPWRGLISGIAWALCDALAKPWPWIWLHNRATKARSRFGIWCLWRARTAGVRRTAVWLWFATRAAPWIWYQAMPLETLTTWLAAAPKCRCKP